MINFIRTDAFFIKTYEFLLIEREGVELQIIDYDVINYDLLLH
jgi:hypothetical protein